MRIKRFVGILLLLVMMITVLPAEAFQVFAMQVNVKVNVDTGERILSFNVDGTDTVQSLKQSVQSETGISPNDYRFFYYGKLLEDENTLDLYEISEGSTLYMMVEVTFISNDETNTFSTKTMFYNQQANMFGEEYAREGYRFKEWNTEPDGSGTAYAQGQSVCFLTHKTLYAQWEETSGYETPVFYIRTRVSVSEYMDIDIELVPTDTVAMVKAKVYDKAGIDPSFYLLRYGVDQLTDETKTLAELGVKDGDIMVTVVAITLMCNYDDAGTYSDSVIDYNYSYELPSYINRPGYKLTGWNTEADGSGISYAPGEKTLLYGQTVLYAQWRELVDAFNVVVSVQVFPDEEPVYCNMEVESAETISDLKARIRSEFSINPNCYYLVFEGNDLMDESRTVAEEGIGEGSCLFLDTVVTFMWNDGTDNSCLESHTRYNTPIEIPSDIARLGYTLVGWATQADGGGTSYALGANVVFPAHTTLYAQWAEDEGIITEIYVGNVAEPVVGSSPSYTFQLDCEGITAGELQWYYYDGDYVLMDSDSVFQKNGSYEARIPLTLEEGASFPEDPYWNVVVNSDFYCSEKHVEYNYDTCEYELRLFFSSVGMVWLDLSTIAAPVVGESPYWTWQPLDHHITLTGIEWRDEKTGESLSGDYIFQKGHVYVQTLKLILDEGCSIINTFNYPGAVLSVDSVSDEQNGTCTVTLRYTTGPEGDDIQLSTLILSGIVNPVAGESALVEGLSVSEGYTISDAYWFCNGTRTEERNTFIAAHSYRLRVVFTLNEGYDFYSFSQEDGIKIWDAQNNQVTSLKVTVDDNEYPSFSGPTVVSEENRSFMIEIFGYSTEGYGENLIPFDEILTEDAITCSYAPVVGEEPELYIADYDTNLLRYRGTATDIGHGDPFWSEISNPYIDENGNLYFEGQRMLENGDVFESGKYYMWAGSFTPADSDLYGIASGHRVNSMPAPNAYITTQHIYANVCQTIMVFLPKEASKTLRDDLDLKVEYKPSAGDIPVINIAEYDSDKFKTQWAPYWQEVANPRIVTKEDTGAQILRFDSIKTLKNGDAFEGGKYYMWATAFVPVDQNKYADQIDTVRQLDFVDTDDTYLNWTSFSANKAEVCLIFYVPMVLSEELEMRISYIPKAGHIPQLDIAEIDAERFVYSSSWFELMEPYQDENGSWCWQDQRQLEQDEIFEAGKHYMWAGQVCPVSEDVNRYENVGNYSRSDFIVAPAACGTLALFYENKVDATVIYYVEDLHHLVTVSSSPVGNAYGQGIYETGDLVTVGVEGVDLELYDFNGWYNGATFLSSSMIYEFALGREDLDLRAVFSSKEGAKTTVNVSADSFEINMANTEQHDGIVQEVDLGTVVIVSYTGEEENFMYWANEGNKIVSTDTTYEFTVGSQVTISAVTTGENSVSHPTASKIMFLSAYNQILSMEECGPDSVINIPGETTKIGYSFLGWKINGGQVYSVDNIGGAIREYLRDPDHLGTMITITPEFERIAVTYTVTVHYLGIDRADETTVFDSVGTYSMEAPEVNGYALSCWKLGDEIISSSMKCPLYVDSNMTLTAEYVAGTVAPPVPTIYHSGTIRNGLDTSTNKYRITYLEMYEVPEEYTLIEHGILYAKEAEYASEECLNLGSSSIGNGVIKKTSVLKDPIGSYGMTFKVATTSEPRYVRAYLTYRDSEDNVYDIYTDVITVTYGEDG